MFSLGDITFEDAPVVAAIAIPYISDFLTKDEADRLFEICKKQPSQRPQSPRGNGLLRRLQMPCYSATPAFRGSRNEKTNPWMRPLDAAPAELKKLADKLTALAGKPINYLSLVGYENEKDHIVWHQHREDDCRDARVFILSLGETRTFAVREVCPEGRLCAKCNDDACRDGENVCTLCAVARQHRKTCPKCKDRKNWTLIQPAHGSLITLPHEWNKTHEHAVLDDNEPKGLRISINTKHLTQEDIDYFRRLEQVTPEYFRLRYKLDRRSLFSIGYKHEMIQKKKPALRAFTGLAGSPLSRGRPRKHVDPAAKQKAYRHKKRLEKLAASARKPYAPDDAMNYASTGGHTTIGGGAFDIIDAKQQAKQGGPDNVYPSTAKHYVDHEGESVGVDQRPDDHKEQINTFVDRHLTKAVLDAFVKSRGHLEKNEAERIVKHLAFEVFGTDGQCNQCDEIIQSGQITHLWTKHVTLIRDILKEVANSRGCPKAFHQLLFEYPKEVLTVTCPICGKQMTQPGILWPELINRSKEDKAKDRAARQAALFNQVLSTLHPPHPLTDEEIIDLSNTKPD